MPTTMVNRPNTRRAAGSAPVPPLRRRLWAGRRYLANELGRGRRAADRLAPGRIKRSRRALPYPRQSRLFPGAALRCRAASNPRVGATRKGYPRLDPGGVLVALRRARRQRFVAGNGRQRRLPARRQVGRDGHAVGGHPRRSHQAGSLGPFSRCPFLGHEVQSEMVSSSWRRSVAAPPTLWVVRHRSRW